MEVFRRLCLFTVARDCAFVALAMLVFMIGLSFVPQTALAFGAAVALLNAGLLILRAARLSDERLETSEPWRVLAPHERPAWTDGRTMARACLGRTLLVFAQGSAALAAVFSTAGLIAGRMA